ncbi:MAG TPA: cell envelope integrity EipB family protein [Stellaceae bacterium]|nr:cell envelope integrity EipB family protein [Stellaceae bacterium]
MRKAPRGHFFAALLVALAAVGRAGAVEIAPHRAIYAMSLKSARNESGVVDAHGMMAYQWGETCDGWTIEQHYRLLLRYAERSDSDIRSSFVTWESKDGLRYRFNQTETRNGKPESEIRGAATLEAPGKGGVAVFSKPKEESLTLAPGVLFPSAHTILLIEKARAGETFVVRHVFDGATKENAVEVSAVIGRKLLPEPATDKLSPLLQRPGWDVRLAFFPADARLEQPDYELGMQLLDNGVSHNMLIDYGDYSIRTKLQAIEALKKPRC